MVVIVGSLFFVDIDNYSSDSNVLSTTQMYAIRGGSGPCEYCGYTGGTATTCQCNQLGDYWAECSGQKVYKNCALVPSTGCYDQNRIAYFTGGAYEDREPELGRRCNGAAYCDVNHIKPVNYLGTSSCFAAYYGCN
jgi:hypothetical protein